MSASPSIRSFSDLRHAIADADTSPIRDFGRGVWIHGAGGFGRKLAGLLDGADIPVLGFIDRRGTELKQIDGRPVFHPDAITDDNVTGACHLHGLMNDGTPSAEITRWAGARGFARLLFPTDLHRVDGVTLRHYWLAPRLETIGHLAAIEYIHDGLADDESREILRSVLRYRLHADPRLHPTVHRADSYAPRFLPIFDAPLTFIDGGAYTGDTVDALLDHGVPIGDWIAFEPDDENFVKLQRTADRRRGEIDSFSLFRLGLSDRNARVSFSNGAGAASHIAGDQAGETSIDIVRADDVVKRKGPLYIKLDVEGEELPALRGMPGLLSCDPVLAVSIYHEPQDLWAIPQFLMDRWPTAAFYIRQHGYHAFDTVFYVVPK